MSAHPHTGLYHVILTRLVSSMVVVGLTMFTPLIISPPAAHAISHYVYDPVNDVAPDDSENPAPDYPMQQKYYCNTSGQLENSDFDTIPLDEVWRVKDLHHLATGEGQTVAVIDSGVAPNERFAHLVGGGDYVIPEENGLVDCDHHGTLVAGIIAGLPRKGDGFSGVAPEATILSIRAGSDQYEVDKQASPQAPQLQGGAISIPILAKAIVHAATHGATVINMSTPVCIPATVMNNELHQLAGALHFAAVERDVVIVASAGNLGGMCGSNPGPDPAHPEDPLGWGKVESVSYPSMFTDWVLSVGGSTLTGEPYVGSMPGPWVGVAAPAVSVVSLDPSTPDGTLTNAELDKKGVQPIAGVSFATAAVSGLAALLRQKYPDLHAQDIIKIIKGTAHSPSDALRPILGAGNADPYLALTVDPKTLKNPLPGPSQVLDQQAPTRVDPPVEPKKHMWWMFGSLAAFISVLLLTLGRSLSFRAQIKNMNK